jgi:hypothetical protein
LQGRRKPARRRFAYVHEVGHDIQGSEPTLR